MWRKDAILRNSDKSHMKMLHKSYLTLLYFALIYVIGAMGFKHCIDISLFLGYRFYRNAQLKLFNISKSNKTVKKHLWCLISSRRFFKLDSVIVCRMVLLVETLFFTNKIGEGFQWNDVLQYLLSKVIYVQCKVNLVNIYLHVHV